MSVNSNKWVKYTKGTIIEDNANQAYGMTVLHPHWNERTKLDYGLQNLNIPVLDLELPNLTSGLHMLMDSNIGIVRLQLPKIVSMDVQGLFEDAHIGELYITAPIAVYGSVLASQYPTNETMTKCELNTPIIEDLSWAFSGNNALSHFRGTLQHLRNGDGCFDGCKLDKESTLHVLNQLNPPIISGMYGDGMLTIGIDAALSSDADINVAIQEATQKGWQITTQYN